MFRKIIILFFACLFLPALTSCNIQSVDSAQQSSENLAVESTQQSLENLVIERSYTKDAPVYSTIAQITADADYVFSGILSRVEPVKGATWQWEIYEVINLYKGIDTPREIRMISEVEANGEAPKHEIGSEYYVFATMYELPVYPYPLINPIYNQTVFEVMDNGQLSLNEIADKAMIPAVFDEQFIQNPAEAITKYPELLKANAVTPVVDRYQGLAEALASSDLVARVIFDDVEIINQYVSICTVKEISAAYEAKQNITLPTRIAVNEDIKVGEEYIIFLKYDSLGESFLLASREGAIISSTNSYGQWDEAVAILNKAN